MEDGKKELHGSQNHGTARLFMAQTTSIKVEQVKYKGHVNFCVMMERIEQSPKEFGMVCACNL